MDFKGSAQRKTRSLGATQCKDKEVPHRRTTLNHQEGLNGGLHDQLTEGGGKLILIHLHRWIKMFSSRCAQKLRKLCEQSQALRTKTLRWRQSHQKRRTSQMANFRSSEAGTNAGFYLQCFREVTGPWYNKHINMKEGGALQANTGVASSMLPNSFLLTRNSNWSSDTNAIQAMAAQKACQAPDHGHLTQLPR